MTSVSVVIPCHNRERYIAQTLRSVAAQSHTPTEVLVVDDASTDASAGVVRREYPQAQVIPASCRNAAAARNVGIERATGDVIAFLDADDWWYATHLEQAVAALATGDAAFLGHRDFAREQNDNPHQWTLETTEPLAVRGERTGLSPELFWRLFLPTRYYASSGLVAVRAAVLDGGMFDPSFTRRHDIEMFLRLIQGRTWACSEQPTYAYRVGHKGTISSNHAECEWYLFRALRARAADYPNVDSREGLRRLARVAVGAARRAGNADLLHAVLNDVWGMLGPSERMLYAVMCPRSAWGPATRRRRTA